MQIKRAPKGALFAEARLPPDRADPYRIDC